MKALIRRQYETVTEADNVPGIDWDNGMPLTCSVWAGGPYTLVNDYVPEDPAIGFAAIPTPASAQDPVVEEATPDTIVIDGVTYTRTP